MDALYSARWVSTVSSSKNPRRKSVLRAAGSEEIGPLEKAAAYRKKMRESEGEVSGRSNEVEVEIITRDGVIKRKVPRPQDSITVEIKKKGMEFVGLNFSEPKKSGRPAGLNADLAAPPPGQLPEVQIITRDAEFPSETKDQTLYKPKVSSWGVFPRPSNISETFGGGRTIKPGEDLETEEEKLSREAKTKELLLEYRRKLGLDIDPQVALECQEIMSQADILLKSGKVRDALEKFDIVIERMVFQSELHGQAALTKALCLESLNRTREARLIYDKLLSHSNQKVKKKAKQLIYSFEAAEKLKMSGTSTWDVNAYRDYFELFPKKYNSYNTTYRTPPEEEYKSEEIAYSDVIIYLGVILAPLIMVFVVVLLKHV